ncbi:MAG: hypothetical protein IT373_31450 [Polyangiaceae bacterium]|nr:hypothetical protein [Polyangiaceae bacterium]
MKPHAGLDASSWALLCHAPLTLWLAMSGVDPAVDSPDKEADAFDTAIEKEKARCSDELVRAVLAEAVAPSGSQRRGLVAVDPESLLGELERVRAVLDERCSAEHARAFKRALVKIGYAIAQASCESVIPTHSGVSQPEERFLARTRRALGLLPPAL